MKRTPISRRGFVAASAAFPEAVAGLPAFSQSSQPQADAQPPDPDLGNLYEFLDWIGGYYERPYSTNPVNDVAVTQASPRHPISRGWKSFAGRDEWYYRMRFRPGDQRAVPREQP